MTYYPPTNYNFAPSASFSTGHSSNVPKEALAPQLYVLESKITLTVLNVGDVFACLLLNIRISNNF